MNAKKWLLSCFLFFLSLIFLVELKYQIYPGNRHVVDYIVNEYIPTLINKKYNTLIIGDSLAHNAFSNLLLKDNILDLTTNQAISMAGNYFLLNRYLEKNQAPKKLYLFCIPDLLHNDLNQIFTYAYFESVFTRKKEIKEIKEIKPNLYSSKFDLNKFLERRKKSLNFGGYKPKKRISYIKINEKSLKKVSNYMNKKIQTNILSAQKNKQKIDNIPKIYLDKIIKLCKNKNISFTLVIEPMPMEYNIIFKDSKWNKYLQMKEINYLNINDYYVFNTYFFKNDATHISGKVNQYYQNLIDKYILDIYNNE